MSISEPSQAPQYYRDPDSGVPALLMELMDESLTFFLEKQQQEPVPLHIQVNILNDVALALAYLHSNGVIHRDLSSNNVLLIGSSRAKVTDFGMSSLKDMASSGAATLTTCPGTQVYMPPEALNETPVYSEKLDCFSFGVLTIQMLSGLFPDPSNRFKSIEVCKPGNSSIKFQAQVLVPEAERRRNHINQAENSSLLPIALACLNDESITRPTASKLCQKLTMLKEGDSSYRKSVQRSQNLPQKSVCTKTQQPNDMELELQRVTCTKDSEIKHLTVRLQELELNNRQLAKEQQMTDLKVRLKNDQPVTNAFEISWTECPPPPIKITGGTATHDGERVYITPQGNQIVYQFDVSEQNWTKLSPCPLTNVAVVMVDNLLTAVGGHSFETGLSNKLHSYTRDKWVEVLPPMPTKRFAVAAVSNRHVLVVAGGFGQGDKRLTTVEIMDVHTHQWYRVSPLNFGIAEASAVIVGGRVYIGGGYRHKAEEGRVMTSSLETMLSSDCEWELTAALPDNRATLATRRGNLLAVGGSNSKNIYVYDHRNNSWELMSCLQEARINPLVVALEKQLIIVGGSSNNRGVAVGNCTDLSNINCSVM